MEAKASLGFFRMSPQKVRQVADEVRGYEYIEAADILRNMTKKAAREILTLLKSAAANAQFINPEVKVDDLFVKKIYVDSGTSLKRFRAKSRGRAGRILKRNSKITIVLSDEA